MECLTFLSLVNLTDSTGYEQTDTKCLR
jgi:hypothetical protein